MSFFLTIKDKISTLNNTQNDVILIIYKLSGDGSTQVKNETWKIDADKSCISITNIMTNSVMFYNWNDIGTHELKVEPSKSKIILIMVTLVILVGLIAMSTSLVFGFAYGFGQRTSYLIFSSPIQTPSFNGTLFDGGTWWYDSHSWLLLSHCGLFNMHTNGTFDVLAQISTQGYLCSFKAVGKKIVLSNTMMEKVLAESDTDVKEFTFDGKNFLFPTFSLE